MEYEKAIAASNLVKSRSWVELNSTGSDRVGLGLVTSGTVHWVRLREILHKMTSNERPESLRTLLVYNGYNIIKR